MKRRSNGVGGHKTSFSIEDIFWASGREIVRQRATTVSELIGLLDAARGVGNLSSTVRVFVLDHLSQQWQIRNATASPILHRAPAATAQVPSTSRRRADSGL